ncbi:MAG: hypothetical protein ACRER1_08955 [Gammaproteobacteria bacterium]
MDTELKRIVKRESYRSYSKVDLIEPVDSGFVFIAAEVDSRLSFLPPSRTKRALLRDCKKFCELLAQRGDVRSAVTFKAFLIPPGKGEFLKRHPEVHIAKFDVTVLIETDSVESARQLRQDTDFLALEKRMREASHYTYLITASNARRIGPVDHGRRGVFFFNYFFADDIEQNLAVWNYTAGWFEQETGLHNSTVLLPLAGEDSQYTIINHCRWDRLRDFFPSLLFKRSFRDYVEANFEANHTAPIPVLYRLA